MNCNRRQVVKLALVGWGALLLVVGGGSRQGNADTLPVPAAQGDFAGLVDIGGHKLYLECHGKGSPTVVLEAGYRNRADIWSVDALEPKGKRTMVMPGVARFTRVCAYDRPGATLGAGDFSRSDPVPMPRTAQEIVADLHALLQKTGVQGPYVLVGHSLGGMFIRLYASTYPNEVVGMVLVDALSEQVKVLLLRSAQWTLYNNRFLISPPPGLKPYWNLETIDMNTSIAQMGQAAAAKPLRLMPLVVLSHTQPFELPSDVPPEFPKALEQAWQAGQNKLAALVPGARHVFATESGHYIQQQQPELVINAIREVVTAVRKSDTL